MKYPDIIKHTASHSDANLTTSSHLMKINAMTGKAGCPELLCSAICETCEHWRPEPRHKLWGLCGRVDQAMQYGAITQYPYDQPEYERVRLNQWNNEGRISSYRDFGCNRYSPNVKERASATGSADCGAAPCSALSLLWPGVRATMWNGLDDSRQFKRDATNPQSNPLDGGKP